MEKGDDRKTDDQKSWPNEQSSFWENLVLHGGRERKNAQMKPLTRILVFGVRRIVKKKETVTSRRQSLVEMIGEIIQLEGDGDNRFVGQDQLPCGIAQQQLGS